MPVVFSFGDHYLHKEDVDPDRFSLIVGETSNLSFFNWHKVPANRPFVDDGVKQKFENLTYDLKNYGIGGTEGEIQNHLASLAYAKESGINMAFTDLNFVDSILSVDYFFDEFKKIKALSNTISLAGVALSILSAIKNRKSFNPETLKQLRLPGILQKFWLYPTGIYIIWKSDNISEFFRGEEDKELSDLLVPIRNLTIAYNTRLVEEYLAKNSDLRSLLDFNGEKKTLFYAGSGHRNAKRLYSEGIEGLSSRLTQSIQDDLDFSVRYLELCEESKDLFLLAKGWDFFVFITSYYSYPIATFFVNDEYKRAPKIEVSDSPRLILWKKILALFRSCSDSEKPLVKKMISRLIKEDLYHFSQVVRQNVPEREAMFYRLRTHMLSGQTTQIDLSEFYEPENQAESEGKVTLVITEGIPFVIKKVGDDAANY